VRFPCVHAVATTPAQRLAVPACSSIQSYQPSPIGLSGRPVHRPFRGLLGVHSRYGLHTRAVTVFRDTLHRRLQPFRCLHDCSGCFRLERLPGGICTHWKSAAFSRRTPEAARGAWSRPHNNSRGRADVARSVERKDARTAAVQPTRAPYGKAALRTISTALEAERAHSPTEEPRPGSVWRTQPPMGKSFARPARSLRARDT
jgi:hypothetical protein